MANLMNSGLKIVLPTKGVKCAQGTKVYLDGVEIVGVLDAKININQDDLITATITIPVSELVHATE